MLLDELLAERDVERSPIGPDPVLTVEPVAVPPATDTSRRAVRQRLVELESAARWNLRSAEEARRALAAEHERLRREAHARTKAQREASALRGEIERLGTEETRRAASERAKAERAARAEVAEELRQFKDEHERVLHEVTVLRSSLSEHDGLLAEYVERLREEQEARAVLAAELERADTARSLAERALQRATEEARTGAEDEMIRLATVEQELADAISDRDRLRSKLDELTAGDGALAKLTADLAARDAELDALRQSLVEAQAAGEVASARIEALESELATTREEDGARARELDRTLGKLRREARDASNGRRDAEARLAAVEAECVALRARLGVAEPPAESALEAPEPPADPEVEVEFEPEPVAEVEVQVEAEVVGEPAAEVAPVEEAGAEVPPPLPTRVAGRHAPAPLPARRKPKREPLSARAARLRADAELFAPIVSAAPAPVPAEPVADLAPEPVPEPEPEPAPEAPAVNPDTARRSALAEFSALATSGSDGRTFRRR